MPEILPEYDGPYTPRMQFEDILGSLVTAAAKYGRRTGKRGEEVDTWERSPAGQQVAFTTYENDGNPYTAAAQLAIYGPSHKLRLRVTAYGHSAGMMIGLDAIQGVSFLMREPQEAADTDRPQVQMHINLGNEDTHNFPLTYQQFAEICQGTGVYRQERLPTRSRIANWVLAHTTRRDSYDARDWH